MSIVDFPVRDEAHRRAAAELLVEAFREHWPEAWPTPEAAEAEVDDALRSGKIAFAALVPSADLLGWLGAQPAYGGSVWELHPLVVRSDAQGRGIGRALVERVEREVRARGAWTLWVASDDEDDLTTIGGVDLCPDVLGKLAALADRRGHPMGFYRRLGFEVVGVVPDANGFGKPDILLAKRVRERQL